MSQYTPVSASDDEVWTHTKINTERSSIATAYNSLDTTNHPVDSVPVTAVVNDNAEFVITLVHTTAVGASQAYTTARSEGVGYTNMAFTLISVTAIAGSVTTNCGVKLYYDGAAASNAITLTTARTGAVDNSPSVTSFSASKNLEIRVETGAGEDASGITVLLRCKKQHVG